MRILYVMGAFLCAAFVLVASPIVAVASWVTSMILSFCMAAKPFMLDHGHPRSPLASLRAGLA